MNKKLFLNQILPLTLSVAVMFVLIAILYSVIVGLNTLHLGEAISQHLKWGDVVVGAMVYLKTSVDFAIFMGLLMASNLGWKNRIAIEIGTAFGNALGTILVLILWAVFKQLHILLAVMIFLAALVLFELAGQGIEHFSQWDKSAGFRKYLYLILKKITDSILMVTHPITSRVLPDISTKIDGKARPWKSLLFFSLSVPFILGLDDFAGYVPLFSVVKIFGFATGTIAAHTLLNLALFISPQNTIKWVKNQWVSFLGTLAFIALGVIGLIEAFKTLL